MFETNQYIFPLFSAILRQGVLRIQRFIGCGFWLDQYGHFATCKHVLDEVAEGQVPVVAQPSSLCSDNFRPVQSTIVHERFDVAVGRAPADAVGGVLNHYAGPIGLGLEVQAFGYTEGGKEAGNYNVDPRLLQGHISRLANESFGLPSPSLIEVSFGSPSGFSGTPLMTNTEVVGILYSNLDSRLHAFSIQETIEGQVEHRETAYRIFEYGIAHRLSDLQQFFRQCGVGADGGA